MVRKISQRDLRNDGARIIRALEEGQSFIVNRNGRPIGELLPRRRERLVDVGLVIATFARAPSIDAKRWRADLDAQLD